MYSYRFVAILFFTLKLNAQITISNIIFYEPGDTIIQNIDNNITHSTITPASAQMQIWNFSSLKATGKRRDTIKGIAPGDSILKTFPSAVLKQPFQNLGTEYLEITNSEVRGLGVRANFFGINFIEPYIGKRIIQFAPIALNTTKGSTSSVNFGIGLSAIPALQTLIQSLIPIPGATIDSIRISLVTKSDFKADAFGELQTPYEKVDVLRVKQEVKTSTKIEAKVKVLIFSTWQDVSTFLPIPLPKDTTFVYSFYTNKVKDPIVTINADKNQKITSTFFRSSPSVPKDTTKIDTTKIDTTKSSVQVLQVNKDQIKIVKSSGSYKISIPLIWQGAMFDIYTINGQRIMSTLLTEDNQELSEFKLPMNQLLFIHVNKNGKSYTEKMLLTDLE